MEYDSNCTQAFTDADKRHTLLAMGSVGASAAVVCFMAVILVLYFKLFKYFAHRLALYQVLAALGLAIALACQMVFITNPENEKGPACETISFFFVYFSWVKLMFISWVVLHLFCFSVFYKNLQNFEILFVCVSVLFPLLFLWAPFISGKEYGGVPVYGSAGAWCWIKNWRNDCVNEKFNLGIGEQFGFWFAPAMVCSVVDSIAIVIIIIRLVYRKSGETSLLVRGQRWKALKELLPLLAYPIIFCIVLVPPVVKRIYGAVFNTVSVPANLVSGSFIPLQPFFAGLTLLIHVCVLKIPKCIANCKCKCNRRRSRYNALQSTFVNEPPSTCDYTQAGIFSTRNATEAYFPDESEYDRSVLSQKEIKASKSSLGQLINHTSKKLLYKY